MDSHGRRLLKALLCVAAVSVAGCYGSDSVELKGPGVLQFGAATYSVSEGAGMVTITVTRTGGTTGIVSVDYATADGTAIEPGDYTAATGTLNWASGDSAPKTFTVTVIDDGAPETSEDFTATLGSPVGGVLGTVVATTVTITDNDNNGTLAFSSAAYGVGESGGTATITVTRTGGSQGIVGVSYATADGTATQPADYATASGTLSWGDGDVADKAFTVSIVGDTAVEGNEVVALSLATPTGGATLGLAAAALTINDDDAYGEVVFSSATYSGLEDAGAVTITVRRINGNAGAVSVDYATVAGGTATAGVDYTAVPVTTLNWADGDTADQTFAVSITADGTAEPNETVNLQLSNPQGGAALGAPFMAVLTIQNDDVSPAGTIAFASAAYNVSEAVDFVDLVVTRTGGSTGIVTITANTVGGGTASSNEYNPIVNVVLTWADGDPANKTVTLTIKNNADVGETMIVELSLPTGGAVLGAPSQAVVTVVP